MTMTQANLSALGVRRSVSPLPKSQQLLAGFLSSRMPAVVKNGLKKSKAKKGTMKRILSYIKPYKKQIIGAMLTAILYVVLNLTTPVLIGQAIDKACHQV